MIDTEIEGPIAWTRATLVPGQGWARLDAACQEELLAVAAELRADPLPALALDPAAFDPTHCRRAMAGIKDLLEHGPGFAIVDGLPLQRIERAEAVCLFLLLSSPIARPVAQKWVGTMIYDVRDTGQTPGHGVRPDVTNVEQSFHTDNSYNLSPPEFDRLLSLHPSTDAGASPLASLVS